MPLPPELEALDSETDVVGDLELFLSYVESGQAVIEWAAQMARQQHHLEDMG